MDATAPGPIRLEKLSVLVIGARRSGRAVARFALSRGATVTLSDADEAAFSDLPADVRNKAILAPGAQGKALLKGIDLIVVSPGIPRDLEVLIAARKKKVAILSEIELASRYLNIPTVAVTGTNGKTTTVTLLGEIFSRAGYRTRTAGNIGDPLIGLIQFQERVDLAVVEVSSFQLEECHTFRPRAAAILNCTPDHLDRYQGMAGYLEAKSRIAIAMKPEDTLVLSADDPLVASLAGRFPPRIIWISTEKEVERGYFVRDGAVWAKLAGGPPEQIIDLSKIVLAGKHNQENVLAAVAVAAAMGVATPVVTEVLATFHGLHHRNETVAVVRGVTYINDSKGTNLGALRKALESLAEPVILIAGGRDKGGDYGDILDVVAAKVREAILIGEAAPLMKKAWGKAVTCRRVATMQEAVKEAAGIAREGEVVLLSPACSSFDMFRDYAERGDLFRQAVEAEKEGGG
jgi:UDP-N-acetylmuramoylalanine--D-glutamate ligase